MDEKLYSKLLYYFTNNIIKVWEKMTGESLPKPRIENIKEGAFVFTGCVTIASFGGGVSGRVIVALDKEPALLISKALLGEKQDDVNNEILFSIGEFLNIISGNAVSSFNNEYEDRRVILSPPSAIYGKNLRFVNLNIKGFNVVFSAGEGNLILNLGISEEKK